MLPHRLDNYAKCLQVHEARFNVAMRFVDVSLLDPTRRPRYTIIAVSIYDDRQHMGLDCDTQMHCCKVPEPCCFCILYQGRWPRGERSMWMWWGEGMGPRGGQCPDSSTMLTCLPSLVLLCILLLLLQPHNRLCLGFGHLSCPSAALKRGKTNSLHPQQGVKFVSHS